MLPTRVICGIKSERGGKARGTNLAAPAERQRLGAIPEWMDRRTKREAEAV